MSELFVCLSALGCGIGVGVIAIVVLLVVLNKGDAYVNKRKSREEEV
jgi:ABC-type lipoprotein release transport system permease subunit